MNLGCDLVVPASVLGDQIFAAGVAGDGGKPVLGH